VNRFVTLPTNNDIHYYTPIVTQSEKEERKFLSEFRSRGMYKNHRILTPYGERELLYFDFTASGCFFSDIEDELNEKVLPYMSNTHTRANSTSTIITHFFEQAYAKVKHYTNASEQDVVLFTGNGSTSAINRLIATMGIRLPEQLDKKYQFSKLIPKKERPVIFRSLMEHHSNDIPWRETIGIDVYIEFDENGLVSLVDLEEKLEQYKDYPMKIGTFSAGSNVTGLINDVDAIARLLHTYNAYAFFDYAAAGPYVPIDMHPKDCADPSSDACRKDAVFVSTHKFVGGPRTPGILIASKELFTNTIPVEPGGGTVLYTSPWDHKYLGDISAREMGGTPAIVQTIQAGLVFDLKEVFGTQRIQQIEHDYLKRARSVFEQNDHILVLGKYQENNLGILSIMLRGVHHNLAVSLFNDLYGIQVRGGCMCAGPYGHRLLEIERDRSESIRYQIDQGFISMKPGWVRISFNHMTTEEEFETMLEAVDYISKHGKDYEENYQLCVDSGEYIYKQ
jgi:selenocysteine lyase/cysteine desulfurase